jgi:hypothetical protein
MNRPIHLIPVALIVLMLSGCPTRYNFPWIVSDYQERLDRERTGLTRSEISIRARCDLTGNNAAWASLFVRLTNDCHRALMEGSIDAPRYNRITPVVEAVLYGIDALQCQGQQIPIPPPPVDGDLGTALGHIRTGGALRATGLASLVAARDTVCRLDVSTGVTSTSDSTSTPDASPSSP